LFDRITKADERSIINIIIKEIIFSYPKDKDKGIKKIKVWNKPDQTFKYDAKHGVCFASSSS